jgi:hypothetical protein
MTGMSEQIYTPTLSSIETYSGLYFDYLDPRPEAICIEDIAHGLSNNCRFAGQCHQFYSVAQHSVGVSLRVREEYALAALLHDASEAYLLDIPRPLKHMLFFQAYRDLEGRVMAMVAEKFGFTLPFHYSIKDADERMLCTEKRDLMGPDEWNFGVDPYPEKITAMLPADAKSLFLLRFSQLTLPQ